jgi:AcrR family transcriptional regulator
MGLRQRKTQRTRAALIRAAVEGCLTLGYEHTTVERIAAAADVSPRTFNRYFDSKDAVFVAIVSIATDDIVALVEAQPAHMGPVEALRRAHVDLFTRIADAPHGTPSAADVGIMLRVITSSPALHQKVIEFRHRRATEVLAARMGVPVDDERLDLANTLFNVTLLSACESLVADTPAELLGPTPFVERIQTAFGRLAELAADVAPASAMT